jgi:hypothetical protein
MALKPRTLVAQRTIRSIFEFGYVAGTDADTAITAAIAAGEPLFLPPGTYPLDGNVSLTSANNDWFLEGCGRKSKIQVSASNTIGRAFYMNGAKRIRFNRLLFEGKGSAYSPGGTDEQNAVYAFDCEDVEIEACHFTNFPGYVVHLHAQRAARMIGNRFYDNPFPTTGESGDILINTDATEGPPYGIILSQNICNSNNKTGISLNLWTPEAVISNNIVVSRLTDGTEPVNQVDFKRKEGITVNYGDSSAEAPESQWSVACTGNVVRNTNWSGIYINEENSAEAGNGVNVAVTGNVIERSGMNSNGGDVNLQAGIQYHGPGSATIVGNIVKDTNLYGYTNDTAGRCKGIRVLAWAVSGGGTQHDAVIVANNIVENVVNGMGIYLYGGYVPVIAEGNVVTNAEYRCLQAEISSNQQGHYKIRGNTLRKTQYLNREHLMWVFSGSNAIRQAQRPEIEGNTLIVEGDLTGTNKALMRLDIDRGMVVGNRFQGNGNTADGGTGIWLSNGNLEVSPAAVIERRDRILVAKNQFKDLLKAYEVKSFSAYTIAAGPIVDQGSIFENVGTRYDTSTSHTDPLFWAGQIEGNLVQVRYTGIPTDGTWRVGDIVWNSNPSVGQPIGWICTTAGGPGVRVFTAMANL